MIPILNTIRTRKARRILDTFIRSGAAYIDLMAEINMPARELFELLRMILDDSRRRGSDEYACICVSYSERCDEVYLYRVD